MRQRLSGFQLNGVVGKQFGDFADRRFFQKIFRRIERREQNLNIAAQIPDKNSSRRASGISSAWLKMSFTCSQFSRFTFSLKVCKADNRILNLSFSRKKQIRRLQNFLT